MVRIQLIQGDIAKVQADGIVCSSPTTLDMTTSVGEALAEAGGEEIREEAKKLAPLQLGDAVETGAGTLPARHIIHAACKDGRGENRASTASIRSSIRRALDIADQLGLETLAVPALGCGEGKYPIEEGVGLLLDEIFRTSTRNLRLIKFVLYTEEDYAIAKEELGNREELGGK